MLQWILETTSRRNTLEEIVGRLMVVNFAAIHTSSNVRLSYVSFTLLEPVDYLIYTPFRALPTCSITLRSSQSGVRFYGTRLNQSSPQKASLGKMWKLDSLFRESQRYNGIGICTPFLVHEQLHDF